MRYIFLDFDGVINPLNRSWDKATQEVKTFPPTKDIAFVPDNSAVVNFREVRKVTVFWSSELVQALDSLQDEDTKIIWLTTWQEEAIKKLNPLLGVDWDVSLNLTTNHGSVLPQIEKWFAMLDWLEASLEPVSQIVWVDDIVTRYFLDGDARSSDGIYKESRDVTIHRIPGQEHVPIGNFLLPVATDPVTGITPDVMDSLRECLCST